MPGDILFNNLYTGQSGTAEKIVLDTDPAQVYSSILKRLPVAIYICDSEGYITFFNDAAAQLCGRTPNLHKERWSGFFKFFLPDGITEVPLEQRPVALAMTNGFPPASNQFIIERPDGTRKWVEAYPQLVYDPKDNITGAINTLLDITATHEVKQQSSKLAAIVQYSEDAIISKTLAGIITSWNPSAEKLFGYTAAEMIGQPGIRIIPDNRLEEEKDILAKLERGEHVDHFETRRIAKSGEILDISLTISPLKDESGRITGVSKIARDITQQKKLNEALRESEERFRMASESVNIGTWDFQPRTKRMIWSEGCRSIYGFAVDRQLISKDVIDHNHPDDKEFIADAVAKALDPRGDGNLRLEHRIIRADNQQVRWVRIQGKAFFTNNQPERFIGTMLDITEEKQAMQQLRESEERLRLAIQSTKLGTWEFEPQTGKLHWSEECRKIYDVPANIRTDYTFFSEHIFADDRELVEAAVRQAMDTGGSGDYDVQFRILRYSDRQPRWVQAHGKVFFDDGQPQRFIGTVLDITAEKTAEIQLKDSLELFQTMADNVPAMIWMSGDDRFNDYFNKAWLAFTGRTIAEESNEGWLEHVHAEDVDSCTATYKQALELQKGFYTEYRLKRHDGQYRWISDNCVPRFSPQGEFAGFISACVDIDDQKRFREKILDSELLFKTISNASPVGLWMTNREGRNVFVNDTWMKWTALPLKQQLADGWLAVVHQEDRIHATELFRTVMQKKEKYSTEFRITRADGEQRWCLSEGFPYYDINGEFAGYAGSVTDITEIRRLEQRKDDFIKMASHELKTPITSIKGYVQLLLTMYEESNEDNSIACSGTMRPALVAISNQVAKLTRLIAELLDLSRIESGKLEMNKTFFEPVRLVEETLEDVRPTISRHHITVQNDFNGLLCADRDRISQVLLNLLTNAVKYSPSSSEINIHITGDNEYVTISVKDQGIGIDKKEHSRVFERFYRVEGKNEMTYPGFGIGLFIAAEIVHRHNGSIRVESEKSKGSVFLFSLPFK